jgi:hypothetical protein
MPFAFPSNPSAGALSTQNSREYRYAGNNTWELVAASGGGGSVVTAAAVSGFPATGSSSNVIYVATDTARVYIWQGAYLEVGSSGGSGGDGTDTVLRDLFKPAAPTSVTVAVGNAQAALSWTAPSVLAQTPITDYAVQFSSDSGTTWATFADGTSTATSATVTGLTNGTGYVFRVSAVNGLGAGAYSSATSSVTPGDVFRAIPTMTSLTAPSGVVSGESNISESGSVDVELWRAFDGNASTAAQFQRGSGNSPSRMLQYAFPAGQKSRITGYSITTPQPGYVEYLSQWLVYGSDDLSAWTEIDSRSGVSGWSNQQAKAFTLSQPANYRAYRWVFQTSTDNGGPNQISTLQITE